MPDQVIDIPGVGVTAFPDSMSEAQINAAATRLYQQANPGKKQPPQSNWTGLGMKAAAAAVPVAQAAVDQVATNPAVVSAGKNIGATVGFLKGAASGNPFTMLGAMDVGERAGGRLAGMAQTAALKVSPLVAKAAPYAQGLSTLSGAQGVNDLAQMVEPNRTDIGVLGMGAANTTTADRAAVMGAQIKALVAQGMSPAEASRTVANAWVKQNGGKQ